MPRTKQTARASLPSHEDVQGALTVASVQMHHQLAPCTPQLSAARCDSILKWIGRAYGGDVFLRPVDWQRLGLLDYRSKVPAPMDLTTLSKYCAREDFDFAGFLDMLRLIWANGCQYNPPGTPVHGLARQMAALAEEVVMDAQQHATDDESWRVSLVYLPIVSTLLQCDAFEPFVPAIDPDLAPDYDLVVRRPMCLQEIIENLEDNWYCSRYDVERDVLLVTSNAKSYNPADHPYHALATDLQTMASRLITAGRPDMEARFFVTSQMRRQLDDNIRQLKPKRMLSLAKLLEKECPDAISDDVVAEGEQDSRSICVDALTLKSFFRIDFKVRRWVVWATAAEQDGREEEDDEEEDDEEEGDEKNGGTLAKEGTSAKDAAKDACPSTASADSAESADNRADDRADDTASGQSSTPKQGLIDETAGSDGATPSEPPTKRARSDDYGC